MKTDPLQAARAVFRNLPERVKAQLAKQNTPLWQGLIALEVLASAGADHPVTLRELASLLRLAGISIDEQELTKAFARVGKRAIPESMNGKRGYRISLPGQEEVRRWLGEGSSHVISIEGGKVWQAYKQLRDVLQEIKSDTIIVDPYFGVGTLEALELLGSKVCVRLLTAKTSEDINRLRAKLGDLANGGRMEIRISSDPGELHDRYLIYDDVFLLLGHGLKDIGKKESFIVQLAGNVVADTIKIVRAQFDQRWEKARRF